MLLFFHYSCSFFLHSNGKQCIWSSYQLPLLSDSGVEESQYLRFSLLNYKAQGVSVSFTEGSTDKAKWGILWVTHLKLCCCSLGQRLFCCRKQELDNWAVASRNGWEGQERLVCLRLGSLFPADRGAVHSRPCSAVWLGVPLNAAASSEQWETSTQLLVPKYRSTLMFFGMFLCSEEKEEI